MALLESIELAKLAAGVALGAGTGCLTGFFGAGGGFILTPALNVLLGLPMPLAVGTSSCQVAGASAFALAQSLDRRLLGMKLALCIGIGVPPGALLGAELVRLMKSLGTVELGGTPRGLADLILLACFAALLAAIFSWMLYDCFIARREEGKTGSGGLLAVWRVPPLASFRTVHGGSFSVSVLAALGLLAGFLSGLLGIGGGVALLPMLFYLVGQDEKAAVSSSLAIVFAAGLFSACFHAFAGNVDFILAASLLAGGLAGSRLGTKLRRSCSGTALKKAFTFVVLGALVLVLAKLAHMLRGGF